MPVAFDSIAAFEAGPPQPQPQPPACSSSSLGNDSDEGSSPGKEGEVEVQSEYRRGGLAELDALEESLPIRRAISKFYNGKSKSFTFLREAITSSGSAKVIAKAENAYTRKRKNLLAYSIMYDKSQNAILEAYESGNPKRLGNMSRATLRSFDSINSWSSCSSISSDETELPQQLHLAHSPDKSENFAPPKIPAPRLGSCAPKSLAALPMSMRSSSMMDLHRLRRSCSAVRLKDKQKAD